jgi:hypothetical protein
MQNVCKTYTIVCRNVVVNGVYMLISEHIHSCFRLYSSVSYTTTGASTCGKADVINLRKLDGICIHAFRHQQATIPSSIYTSKNREIESFERSRGKHQKDGVIDHSIIAAGALRWSSRPCTTDLAVVV